MNNTTENKTYATEVTAEDRETLLAMLNRMNCIVMNDADMIADAVRKLAESSKGRFLNTPKFDAEMVTITNYMIAMAGTQSVAELIAILLNENAVDGFTRVDNALNPAAEWGVIGDDGETRPVVSLDDIAGNEEMVEDAGQDRLMFRAVGRTAAMAMMTMMYPQYTDLLANRITDHMEQSCGDAADEASLIFLILSATRPKAEV